MPDDRAGWVPPPSEDWQRAHPEWDRPDSGPIWIDDAGWDEAAIPRRQWVAPGYALRGCVTLLSGPPSALKSSLILGWCCGLALGREFGRFRPREPGISIVYDVEDDRDEQRRRLSAVLRHFGAAPADIAGRVIRVGPRSIGTLIARDTDGTIRFTPAMQAIEALVIERKPAWLIVDPFAELHCADENDNTAIRAVIAAFREVAIRHDIAVIIIHHTRKGAASPGDPDSARGASSIIGAVRIAMTLTTMSEDDARTFGMASDHKSRTAYVRLDDAKSNYSAIRDAEWFEKGTIELANGEIVAAAVPWVPPATKVASLADLAALATAIERGTTTGDPWSPKLSAEPRSVRALLEQHGFLGRDAQKDTLRRLMADCHVETGRYRGGQRRAVSGLHIAHRPAADWLDDQEIAA